jgi:hypothetical protein
MTKTYQFLANFKDYRKRRELHFQNGINLVSKRFGTVKSHEVFMSIQK